MERLVIVAVALLSAAITLVTAKAENQTSEQICATEGMWAHILMGFRQLGKPPSALIQEHPDMRAMIIMAYDYPRYNTKEMQDRAREDLQIDIEKLCLGAIGGK